MAKPTKRSKSSKRAARAKPTTRFAAAPAKPGKAARQTKRTPAARAKPTGRAVASRRTAADATPNGPNRPREPPATHTRPTANARETADAREAAEPDADAANEPGRAARIATLAADRARVAADDGAPVVLGSITVPSGTLAIFDVGLMGYLPRPALDPLLVCTPVPGDHALPVIGTRVSAGRFAGCWDHVAVQLGGDRRPVASTRKLGEAASDFAQLICMDRAAIDHWQHEDSLDQLADFVFSGRDEAALAKALGARRLGVGDGHGWHDLPIAEAEALADRAAVLKAEHRWLLTTQLRPHSHHFDILGAARASSAGAGVLEVGGARVLLFFTSWGEGVFPVFLDVDAEDRPVQVRIQLAAAASQARAVRTDLSHRDGPALEERDRIAGRVV